MYDNGNINHIQIKFIKRKRKPTSKIKRASNIGQWRNRTRKEKITFLEHQILEAQKTGKILQRQKNNIQTNIDNLEIANKNLNKDIEKFRNDIQKMENDLKEIQDKKNLIDELQKSIDYYTKENEKLRKEKNEQ